MTSFGKKKTTVRPQGGPLSDHDFHTQLSAAIPHLRAFARSLCRCRDTADDLAQETLLKAWTARDHFVAGTSFHAWTFTILRNVYYGQMRRQRFVGEYDELEAERTLRVRATQQHGLEATDVLRAMQHLPKAQREVLVLAAVGHVSYDEMSGICGVPVGTIKSRLARARTALSAVIDNGAIADSRHDFVLKGDIFDAFLDELRKIAPAHVIARLVSAA